MLANGVGTFDTQKEFAYFFHAKTVVGSSHLTAAAWAGRGTGRWTAQPPHRPF